jgi:hypothetical protein
MVRAVTRWRVAVPAVLVAVAALSACTTSAPEEASATSGSGPSLAWAPVALPEGVEVRTLTTMADRLLVGGLKAGSTPDTPSPVMLTVDASGAQSPIPLTPHSPYAPLARWYSVATDGTRIIAIGGANGGAHANVRWTTWAGTASGVDELPQSFYAFGGWGAGDLVDAVITPAGDALVGSWGGAQAGLDAAVWTFAGQTWTRQDPAGTALESTAALLVGPRGATDDAAGILVTGSALHLDQGVGQTAAVWRSASVDTGWHRIDLPDAGTHSESVSAHCTAADAECLVAGQVDGRLALWSLRGDTATRHTAVPDVAVGDQDVIPRPIGVAPDAMVVSPSAQGTVVVSSTGERWASSAGPPGAPVAAARVGDRLYVATRPAPGAVVTLSAARWPG